MTISTMQTNMTLHSYKNDSESKEKNDSFKEEKNELAWTNAT